MILSRETGKFKGLWFDPVFQKKNLLDVYCTAHTGDQVHAYQNTSHSLGTILFKADSIEEMIEITSHIERYYKVEVYVMRSSEIYGCYAQNHGGGIYSDSDNNVINMYNSKIKQNTARSNGGGIYIDGEQVKINGQKNTNIAPA